MNSPSKKLILCLFSDANFLSVNLLEHLLSKNCLVNIVTEDIKGWQEKTLNLANKTKFSILQNDKTRLGEINYSIVVAGFIKGDPYDEVEAFLSKHEGLSTKTIIVMPFEKYSFEKDSRLKTSNTIGVVYLGDLLGGRMDSGSDLLTPQIIRGIVTKKEFMVAEGETFYPTFIGDVAKELIRWLFSFGPYGSETFLGGSGISALDFWKENQKIVGEIKFSVDEEAVARTAPETRETKRLEPDLKVSLTETYKWFRQNPHLVYPGEGRLNYLRRNKKKGIVYPRFFKPALGGAILVLMFPVFCAIISLGLFYLASRQFMAGNDAAAQSSILLGKTLSVISREESRGLGHIPLLGRVYKEISFVSQVGVRGADIAIGAIPVVRASTSLSNKILGDLVYDPTGDAEVLSGGMDSLYRDISLLQTDEASAESAGLVSARILSEKIDIGRFRNLALQGKVIAQNLTLLLGKDKSKTYLLLFQNNMELRPTGGFIGSFGILTFDGGRITDLVVNDVYSADGQLNGHVEPPAALKKYLGEANWWLRDSNWDPDFTTSAQRAEWFLDKETGRQVDGVIAIDLAPIKEVLKYTGPIFLADYNLDITSANLYEKTQAETEANFFPGSRRKASFLSALARSLLSEVSRLNTGQKVGIIRSFYNSLVERHIQLFIHDNNSQKAVSALGWDGAVKSENCGKNCYPDLVGLVEANVGVNKANYFVKRDISLDINFLPGKIQRKLLLSLENNSNPALGLSGKYKVYVRLLTPKDVNIREVNSLIGENSESLTPEIIDESDRKETGVLTEVLGGQKKVIEFVWDSGLDNGNNLNSYGLYLRKQSGVSDDPLRVVVNSGGTTMNSIPGYSLTPQGGYVYNTTLTRDFYSRFSW